MGADAIRNLERARALNLHATFNGGHEDEGRRRAFHHGMDTVCNVLAAHQRGDGTNGILPAPPQETGDERTP